MSFQDEMKQMFLRVATGEVEPEEWGKWWDSNKDKLEKILKRGDQERIMPASWNASYYWDDYYVFDRHTGKRLSLEDFVKNSPEEIKEIVKNHILAVAPYSGGEQSEDALEQDRFFLTSEGLGIHYDVYEIGSYSDGPCDLIIPFGLFDMKDYMWPEPLAR